MTDEQMANKLILFLIILAIIAVLLMYISYTSKKDKEKKGYLSAILMNHVSGVPDLEEKKAVQICLYDDRITIDAKQIIPLTRIKRANAFTDKEVREHDKSVVGRAMLGGLLLGPLGAVIGGLSGIGSEKSTKKWDFLAIEFINKEGSDSVLLFATDISFPKHFAKELNAKIGYMPEIQSNESYEI